MAIESKIHAKNGYVKIILWAVVILMSVVAYVYMYGHYTTEELAKWALIKYLFE